VTVNPMDVAMFQETLLAVSPATAPGELPGIQRAGN
jgi:hypothetical protein